MSVLRSLLTAGVLASGLLWSLNGITATPAAQASGDRCEVTQQRNPDAACLDCHKPDTEGMHGKHASVINPNNKLPVTCTNCHGQPSPQHREGVKDVMRFNEPMYKVGEQNSVCMTWSRRQFLTGVGVLAAVSGTAGRVVAKTLNINGVRYGMVHDESLCIGCTACMDACREVNKVPEGVSRLTIIRSEPQGEFPDVKYRFFRKSCQHCDHAPCVDVCPTGASFRDAASGIVDVNPDLCVGCQYCIAACPYRVRFIHPVTKTADKCDFCRKTNLQAGKLPACVEACPTKALTFGNLDDPNSEISQVLRQKPTYRYKLALGTKPKLYRVPFKYGEVSQ